MHNIYLCKKINEDFDFNLYNNIIYLSELKSKLTDIIYCDYNPIYIEPIHGDCRPTNIMILNDSIKFIDFDYSCIGDMMYELGTTLILFSDYNVEVFKELLLLYNSSSESNYQINEVLLGTLMSILQSSFPLSKINKIKSSTLKKIVLEKIKVIKFCYEYLYPTQVVCFNQIDCNDFIVDNKKPAISILCKHSFKSNSRTLKKIVRGNCIYCNNNIIDWEKQYSLKKNHTDYLILKNNLTKEFGRNSYWNYKLTYTDLKKINIDPNILHNIIIDRLNKSIAKPKILIFRDGTQTPKLGNPIYIAQHALGLCCRKCLYEWYNITYECQLNEQTLEKFAFYIESFLEDKINEFSSEQSI